MSTVESMMMGMAKNIVIARGQHFPLLTSNSSHCYPADGIFDNIILVSHAICRYGLVIKKIASEIEHVYRLHHRLCGATPLYWLLSP